MNALTGGIHLLIRFRDILGVSRFDSGKALFFQETVKTRNRTLITALHKFDPEDDETGVRITPAHIGDVLDLIRGMLVEMMMGLSGSVPEGFDGAVEAVFPAVDKSYIVWRRWRHHIYQRNGLGIDESACLVLY